MLIKQLVDEDFVNYKKPAMFIAFPTCSWKCEIDCGKEICQNKGVALEQNINVYYNEIVERYISNPLTSAIVMGGLEPFDTANDLIGLVSYFRKYTQDDIVIYTGYTQEEVAEVVKIFTNLFPNVIIKYGRFIPNQESHYDEVLGVKLASDNQYAVRVS